jgi:hypothetical protein
MLSFLLCGITPLAYVFLDRWGLEQAVAKETPLKNAVSDVCDQLFRDPEFMSQSPRVGNSGYYQVGTADHVLIWEDETGDAYWFDVADSLSSGGYICIRPGLDVESAIWGYARKASHRQILPMYDNLYWWN